MKKLFTAILCLTLCLAFAGSAMARTVSFGSAGYEPLRWDVLYSNDRYSILLSEKCVACHPFGGSNSWSSSSLRSWLNNSYLYSAFTSSERRAMYSVEGDLIRIPSVGDMTNPQYGFSANRDARDRDRSARASSQAINQGVWTNDSGYCSYYTMTPCDRTSMYQIRTDGRVGVARIDRDNVGVGVARIDRDNVGVRIIIKVETSALR